MSKWKQEELDELEHEIHCNKNKLKRKPDIRSKAWFQEIYKHL